MVNILFVCTGDTCRSTMASAIMKEKIRTLNLKNMRCSSAGLFVGQETAMNECAKKAIRRMDIKTPKHSATQLTEQIIAKYDYVLTMTDEQKQTILNRFPYFRNVHSIRDFVGAENVADPYGKSEAEYYRVARYLEVVVTKVIERIKNERSV